MDDDRPNILCRSIEMPDEICRWIKGAAATGRPNKQAAYSAFPASVPAPAAFANHAWFSVLELRVPVFSVSDHHLIYDQHTARQALSFLASAKALFTSNFFFIFDTVALCFYLTNIV